jgi:D-serine deaminase-like pyridoxal phosphate-dependent protein
LARYRRPQRIGELAARIGRIIVALVAERMAEPFADLADANAAAITWCVEIDAAAHSESCAVPTERLSVERELIESAALAAPEHSRRIAVHGRCVSHARYSMRSRSDDPLMSARPTSDVVTIAQLTTSRSPTRLDLPDQDLRVWEAETHRSSDGAWAHAEKE